MQVCQKSGLFQIDVSETLNLRQYERLMHYAQMERKSILNCINVNMI